MTALALGGVTEASADTTSDHAQTQFLLDAYRLTVGGPGAIVVAGDRSHSWSLSSGTAVVSANQPMTHDQRVRVASQSKTFTAAIVLQLVAEGKIDLEQSIEQYLPSVIDGNGYDGSRITVREILQHTSGIAEYLSLDLDNGTSYTYADLIHVALAHPPTFAPGTGFNYSNTNYVVAAMLVERVTGQPIRAELGRRIITPLGLVNTRLPDPGDRTLGGYYARGYDGIPIWGFSLWTDVTARVEPSLFSTAGAIVSTPDDMITFMQALIDGKIVPPSMLAEMRKFVSEGPNSIVDYGLGLMHMRLSCGVDAWGHAGDVPGYSSLTMATDDGRRATVVTNRYTGLELLPPTRFQIVDQAICSS